MSTSNKVFQVLVTKGNQAVAAGGTALDALRPGQLGFFDADSNVALAATVDPVPDSWFVAVGLGSGQTASDMRFSAGQEIQTRNFRNLTYKKASTATPTIVDITDIVGKCGEDYSLKLDVTSATTMNLFAFRPFSKSYAIQTSCCEGCEPCPSGSSAEVAGKLVKKINADAEAPVTAKLFSIAPGALPGDPPVETEVTDIDAYMADANNKTANVLIRLTTKTDLHNESGFLQTQGFDAMRVDAFLGSGFDCAGKVTVTQQGKQAEGMGHFIKEKEYVAGGYHSNPGVYRTSGMFNETYPQTQFLTDETLQYNQINLVYDHHSKSGWLDYLNDLNTLIAIPTTDTITATEALAVISALVKPAGQKAVVDAATVDIAERDNA